MLDLGWQSLLLIPYLRSALRTARERQPWVESHSVPTQLLGSPEGKQAGSSVSKPLHMQKGARWGCGGPELLETLLGAVIPVSHSLHSSFQLCSASVLGWMHFLRPAYSCCIGNFIVSPITIMGAASKESKKPLQGGITFDTANLCLVPQVGVRPTLEGRCTGAHPSRAQALCRTDPSQPH